MGVDRADQRTCITCRLISMAGIAEIQAALLKAESAKLPKT